ncbi:MAG: putative Modification methylase, HemK family [Candidatus Saccharibacteria bacterium]|nr:putative Modification methylase, HemK family [Candidatus Saccharibacteria bacterium]
MNENLQPKTLTINEWVTQAMSELISAGIGTAKLDAELILSHTLRKGRTYLHMYRDEELPPRIEEIANSRLALRVDRVPLAYITGHKEFYGRRFIVNPSVLIPRPESEAIIDILKELLPNTKALPGHSKRLVDVGTGSGCLGITAKLEFPELEVTLTDISRHALTVAERNADALQADVTTLRSDLLKNYVLQPDIIIANLPYVDESWERSPETEHEPSVALFARSGGLGLINKLLVEASEILPTAGLLLLEADPEQHEAIQTKARSLGLSPLKIHDYCLALKKR